MTTFSDSFDRPDGTDLGLDWIEVSGDWSIVSGQLSPGAASGTIINRAAVAMATSDHYAQASIVATTSASQGVWCRGNMTDGLTSGYLWRNDGTEWTLFVVDGGGFTSLGSYVAAAAPGDVARVQAVGSAITGFVNGTARVSVVNTTVSTGLTVGIRSESVGAVRYDNFTAADIVPGVVGSASGTFGGLSGIATGTRRVTGAASGALGGLAGAASGARRVLGAAVGALAGLSGNATGRRTVVGTATMTGGALHGSATGTRAVTGSATGQFGGLDTVTATSDREPAPAQGSWYGLLDILQEGAQLYREDRERMPTACEDCGEPLRTGPRGDLYCPFDGSIWGPGPTRLGQVGVSSGRW
ncbi:hypothetical protein [Streptomyces sp. NPDC016845]|uniref:hypothetical protein n=1 Tax=Streptomyces sp. NPDC016845 TaxID=3364972 RepID=UPI0037B6C5E7